MQSSSVADDYALWHDSLEIYCMFTFAAFCSLSPDSPTQMLSTSFATRISRILFWDFFSLCTQQWRHKLCSAADTGTKQCTAHQAASVTTDRHSTCYKVISRERKAPTTARP